MKLLAAARAHPVVAILWLLVAVAAAVQLGRAAVFALDADRRECSIQPWSQFRSEHNCFTAYHEATRLAHQGGANIYDAAHYRPDGRPRRIGPLTVDLYHYPPTFLLLPAAVYAVAPDFMQARGAWFGLQVLALAAGVFGTAWWIGGREGVAAALAGTTLLAVPTTWAALQSGNFQVTAISLSMLGLALGWSGRIGAGATLLAYTASGKLFPSMLVLHAIAARRWRFVAGVAVAGLALAGLTAAVFGVRPFVDFVVDELPALSSGAAFPQIEEPRVLATNLSVYGLAVKLRALGASWLDPAGARLAARVYAVLLACLTVWAGMRSLDDAPQPGRARLRRASAWLGMLNLASFAGPFVGGLYGAAGTMWLVAWLAAGASTLRGRAAWLVALAAVAFVPWATPAPGSRPTPPLDWVALAAAWQVCAVAINSWAVWRVTRETPEAAAAGAYVPGGGEPRLSAAPHVPSR